LKTERESSICPKALGFVWIYGGGEEGRDWKGRGGKRKGREELGWSSG